MAIAAGVIWEVQTGGSDTACSGGFNPANASMATDLTTDSNTGNTASPVVSSASYNFAAGDVGHWVFIKSGTNWIPGWYKIASVASNKATLTATIGSAVLYKAISGGPTQLNFAVTTAVGVATVGTPTSGTWTVDYSQSTTTRFAFTDLATVTTTTFTSAAKPIGKNMVGNIVSITSGTGWNVVSWEVSSVTGTTGTATGFSSGSTIATHPSTGGTGSLGGAYASPGEAASLKVASNMVFLQSGTYSIASATPNVATGIVSDNGGANGLPGVWEAYQTIRSDRAARAVLQVAGGITSVTVFALTVNHSVIVGIEVDGQSNSTVRGFSIGGSTAALNTLMRCKALNCTNGGFVVTSGAVQHKFCQATGCATASGGFVDGGLVCHYLGCESWANTVSGFIITASHSRCIMCLSYSNTGASSDGFAVSLSAGLIDCVTYGNGRAGFNITAGAVTNFVNCVAEGNTDKGWLSAGATQSSECFLYNCAGYNNSVDYDTAIPRQNIVGFVAQSAGSFFTNAASGDFSLNNTAGRGALLRATGFPGTFPRGTTVGYQDIGVQHADPAATTQGHIF